MQTIRKIVPQIFSTKEKRPQSDSHSGPCGAHAQWSFLPEKGELRISGTGRTFDFYGQKTVPWQRLLPAIRAVVVEDGITYIGFQAFCYGKGIRSVLLPPSLSSIGQHAFAYCAGLETIGLPEGLEEIGDYAFAYCSGLGDLAFPSGLRTIGKSAFTNCDGFRQIVLPEGIAKLGSSAFNACRNLSAVRLPESLQQISSECFSRCTSLADVSLPQRLSVIGASAFEGCAALASISLPAAVTAISRRAFAHCTALTRLEIPASVRLMEPQILAGCHALQCLTLPFPGCGTSAQFHNFADLFGNTPDDNMCTVRQIAADGEGETFYLPMHLSSLALQEGCELIPSRAMYNCYMLKELHLPASLYMIRSEAFCNCVGLTAIYCHGKVPPSVSENSFQGIRENICRLFVPKGQSGTYISDKGWHHFANIEEF